jgi:hypothetical protein
MVNIAALLLLASAPAPAATPPAPSVSAVGIARARILRPVQVTRMGELTATATADRSAPLVTHTKLRRDGVRVVDCY